MAILVGLLLSPSLGPLDAPRNSVDLDGHIHVPALPEARIPLPMLRGALAIKLPVTAMPRTLSAHLGGCYVDDYYHRIHAAPEKIDVGNLAAERGYNLYVWNACFTPTVMTALEANAAHGIYLTGADTLPSTYAPLLEKTYRVIVGVAGPAVIDERVVFHFDIGSPSVHIVGNRAVPTSFVPQRDVTETLEWKTDVIRTKASEQRIALRHAPRQTFTYKYWLDERQAARLRAMFHGWSHRVFALPVWTEGEYIGPVAKGATEIKVSTAHADYRVGAPVFIWQDDEANTLINVTAVSATGLTLEFPVAFEFTSAYVMPVRYAKSRGLNLTREASKRTVAEVEYWAFNGRDKFTDIKLPVYQKLPVLTDVMIHLGKHEEKIIREVATIDNEIGLIQTDPIFSHTDEHYTLSWEATNRADLWRIRQWLYSLKGRLKTFWLPTGSADLVLTQPVLAGSNIMQVRTISYSLYYTVRALQMVFRNGSIKYFTVTGSQMNGGIDNLLLSEPVTAVIMPGDVERISLMCIVRLDSDRVEIQHTENNTATIQIPAVSVPT